MRPGVVVEVAGRRLFVSAQQACAVLEAARPSAVPGAMFSLVWFEGEALVAVPFEACVPERQRGVCADPALGSADLESQGGAREGPALICALGERRYALVDVKILASGLFEPLESRGEPGTEGDTDGEAGSEGEWVRYDRGVALECVLCEPRALFGRAPLGMGEPDPAAPFRGTLLHGEAPNPEDLRGSEEADSE